MNGLKLDRFLSIIADKSATIDLCPFILFFIIVENILKREERKNKNWNISENIFYDYYDIYILRRMFENFWNVLNIWTRRIQICYSDFPIVCSKLKSMFSVNFCREIKKEKKKKKIAIFKINQSELKRKMEIEIKKKNKKDIKSSVFLPCIFELTTARIIQLKKR